MKSRSPDKRIQRYLVWYYGKLDGEPEDQFLRGLEERGLGEFGSPEALYQQLANDGFPVCTVCGETPVNPNHCKTPSERRRWAKGGSLDMLPPAGAARDLSLDAFEGLKVYIDSLGFQVDWLLGNKQFVTARVDRGVYKIVRRTECSEGEWKNLCELCGVSPEETATLELPTMESSPAGLNRNPSEKLAALIAAYALPPTASRGGHSSPCSKPCTPILPPQIGTS